MAQQLIYTSARRLLQAGQSGFGTVARSKALTGLTVGSIERMSQFASLRGYDRSRVIFAHRRVTVGNNRFHLLSSIRDAGSDYTSRTNHIAHHLVVAPNEAARLGAAGINPADALNGFEWCRSWEGAPKLYGPEEDIDLMATGSGRETGSRRAWEAATGNGLHARLLADPEIPRTGVLAIPDGVEPLPLLAEAIAEKDGQHWEVTFTTCLEQGDELADFDWIMSPATLLGSVQSRCGSRTFLRVDQPGSLKVPAERQRKIPVPTGVASSQRAVVPEPTLSVPGNQPVAQASLVSAEGSRDAGPGRLGLGDFARGQRQPNRVVVILSAAAAVAALLLVAVLLLKQGGGNEGKKNSDGGSGKGDSDENSLVSRLGEMGMDDASAKEIADSLSTEEQDEWDSYLLAIKDLPDKTDWKQLRKIPPKGKLPDDSDLAYLIDKKKGIPRLAELAVSDQWGSAQWKEFDACVPHLLDQQGTIFKKGDGAQPKPWVGRCRDKVLPGLVTARLEQLQKEASKSPGLVKEVKSLALWKRDEFKKEEISKLLADLPVPAAVAKNEPKKPETPKPKPPKPESKPPRVIRRIVERKDLETGVESTLLKELLLETKPKASGGLYEYEVGEEIKELRLGENEKAMALNAESEDGPYEWVCLDRNKFFEVRKGGTIIWSKEGNPQSVNRKDTVNQITIATDGDKEEILVCPRVSGDDVRQTEPLWGEHFFEPEVKGGGVLIKGELGKKLRELKDPPALQVVINNAARTSISLDAQGEEWFIVGVIKKIEVLKLKPKMEKEKRKRPKKGKNGEVEKGKDGKPVMEDYQVDISREHLEGVLKANKGQLEKIGKSTNQGNREKQVAEQEKAAKALYREVKERTPKNLQGKVKSDWEHPGGSPQLIKFAELLLNRSEPSRIQQENENAKNKVLNTIRLGLEVWTEKGTNDKERHLLFEAKVKP